MADMPRIMIERYAEKDEPEFAGSIQPDDFSWVLFVRRDGQPVLYNDRDPETGAYLPEHLPDGHPTRARLTGDHE